MKNKKKIREEFRREVFERDKYTCKVCGIKRPESELDAHHITDRSEMFAGGYVKENGITLCKDECHMRCEKYHISGGLEWEEGLHPDDLYKKINSSLEEACKESEKL
jgi:5-methylcytosine-specific restriction endonuclease McrA